MCRGSANGPVLSMGALPEAVIMRPQPQVGHSCCDTPVSVLYRSRILRRSSAVGLLLVGVGNRFAGKQQLSILSVATDPGSDGALRAHAPPGTLSIINISRPASSLPVVQRTLPPSLQIGIAHVGHRLGINEENLRGLRGHGAQQRSLLLALCA